MDSRNAHLSDDDLAAVGTIPLVEAPHVEPQPSFSALESSVESSPGGRFPWARLDARWTIVLGLGWPAVYGLIMLLAPVPTEEAAAAAAAAGPTLLDTMAAYFVLAGAATSILALVRHRALAPSMGVVAGGIGLAAHIGCAAGGHVSPTAGWWVAVLGAMAAMTAVSLRAVSSQFK